MCDVTPKAGIIRSEGNACPPSCTPMSVTSDATVAPTSPFDLTNAGFGTVTIPDTPPAASSAGKRKFGDEHEDDDDGILDAESGRENKPARRNTIVDAVFHRKKKKKLNNIQESSDRDSRSSTRRNHRLSFAGMDVIRRRTSTITGSSISQKLGRKNSNKEDARTANDEAAGNSHLGSRRRASRLSTKSLLSRAGSTRASGRAIRNYFGSPCKESRPVASSWWESLSQVARQAHASISTDERKRQEVLHEVVVSERAYVDDLSTTIRVLAQPLRKLGCVTQEEATLMFGNLDDILSCHQRLVESIHINTTEHHLVRGVAAEFEQWIQAAAPLYKEYFAKLSVAQLLFHRKLTDDKFASFVQSARDLRLSRRQDLSSFLDNPRRRLLRYPLLLDRALKYTTEDKEEHQRLAAVIGSIRQSISQAETAMKEDHSAKLADIQRSLEVSHSWQSVDLLEEAGQLVLRSTGTRDGKPCDVLIFQRLLLLLKRSKKSDGMMSIVGKPIRPADLEFDVVSETADAPPTALRLCNMEARSLAGSLRGTLSRRSTRSGSISGLGKIYTIKMTSPEDCQKIAAALSVFQQQAAYSSSQMGSEGSNKAGSTSVTQTDV